MRQAPLELDGAQLPAKRAPLRHRTRHFAPKRGRMIEVDEMAQLVDHDIVGKLGAQKRDSVIEVEIALFGAATQRVRLFFINTLL